MSTKVAASGVFSALYDIKCCHTTKKRKIIADIPLFSL